MTFLACALHQLFVRSCDLAHHGLHCSHVCVCTHHSSLQHLLFCVRFRCSSVSIWMNFSACGCLLAPQGGMNHSYYKGSSFSALHSLQQLQAGASSPCADVGLHTGVTWCSDFKLCVLPTGYTQCQWFTGSDGPHTHCHK